MHKTQKFNIGKASMHPLALPTSSSQLLSFCGQLSDHNYCYRKGYTPPAPAAPYP